jgi:hypothetical protein
MKRDLLLHRDANTCRLCEVTRCEEKLALFVQNASKIKVKLFLDTMSASGVGGMVLLILNFSTGWKWVLGLIFRPLYPGRVPGASRDVVVVFLEMRKWI